MSTKKNQTGMVKLETGNLKERLNKLYDCRKGQSHLNQGLTQEGMFEYLWDLKERALLEKRQTVEVPSNWLDELEDLQEERRSS
ncbi:MAG: hypothetical protein LCH63_11245 [Candidatus Melainabacteria bacterium]|jgi:hypothetical protein|uniref:Uncharacterized protein n=1 Tax=Candidatus Obscuribacter phosphatis TaxID=1906157 RepID=A0A8J7P9V6_9BACT|nr:hypothetical protein [Candidatus Obscuribacter phosphatis]MCA0314396.1 hypothetical protein [Candidatus Melainabacteria bacterium]OPZ81497.1 MAG: hypothetical protein BWY75_03536 [bacterium ADurb.Bin425]